MSRHDASFAQLKKLCVEYRTQGLHNDKCTGKSVTKKTLVAVIEASEKKLAARKSSPKSSRSPSKSKSMRDVDATDVESVEIEAPGEIEQQRVANDAMLVYDKVKGESLDSYGVQVKELGRGAYGVVYLTTTENGDSYALKYMTTQQPGELTRTTVLTEVALSNLLKHTNLVGFVDAFIGNFMSDDSYTVCIVMPVYRLGSLQGYMHGKGPNDIPLGEKKRIMYHCFCAVSYMHTHDMLHLDIKPQNILLDRDSRGDIFAVVADYGLAEARYCSHKHKLASGMVTVWWRPPEIFLDLVYGWAADVWSLGVVMSELFTSEAPIKQIAIHEGNNDADLTTMRGIVAMLGRPSDTTMSTMIDKFFKSRGESAALYYKLKTEQRVERPRIELPDHTQNAELDIMLEQVFTYAHLTRPSCYELASISMFDECRASSRAYPVTPRCGVESILVVNAFTPLNLELMRYNAYGRILRTTMAIMKRATRLEHLVVSNKAFQLLVTFLEAVKYEQEDVDDYRYYADACVELAAVNEYHDGYKVHREVLNAGGTMDAYKRAYTKLLRAINYATIIDSVADYELGDGATYYVNAIVDIAHLVVPHNSTRGCTNKQLSQRIFDFDAMMNDKLPANEEFRAFAETIIAMENKIHPGLFRESIAFRRRLADVK